MPGLTELAHTGQLASAVLAALPGTGVLVFDHDLRLALAAGQALDQHGWRAEQIEGRTLAELAEPEHLAALEPRWRAALRGEVVRYDQTSLDRTRVYRTEVAPIRMDGAIVGAMVVSRDVTEAHHANAAVVDSERRANEADERFEAAFREAPAGQAIVALDGMWLKVNRALCALTGYAEEQLVGMTFRDLSHPDDGHDDAEEIARLLAGQIDSYRVERRYLRADGRPIWVAVNGSLVRDHDGRPLYLIAHVEDIGERRRRALDRERLLQREREQIERLRELDRLKDDFVTFVSHELRTPLTSIRGYAELLDEFGHNLEPEQRRYIETIARNGNRLNRLVEDLLAYFQLEDGRPRLASERVDMVALLSEAVESAGPAAVRKQLSLTTRIAPEAAVTGDEDRLAQVIDNLVSNAIKYTPEGGEVEISLHVSAGEVLLEVADTGIGIPEAERERLFDRFFRASNATERSIPGNGLGLAITRGLVEAHGGRISAQPRDPGTRFLVQLPLAPALERAVATSPLSRA